MDEKPSETIWYSRAPLCSRNALFNFCLGARGVGKTFDYKNWAMHKPEQTVWIRRTKEDIMDVTANDCLKFLSDLRAEGKLDDIEKFDDEGKSNITLIDGSLCIDGIPKIFFVPLSTSRRKKSSNYRDVDIMVFDEFLEKNDSDYLKKEMDSFLELYETVNRLRLDRREVRVFFLANAISFDNPYFAYYNILPFEQRFKMFKDGLICVENYQNEEFVELKKQTKFGRLIEGTRYAEYAIENKVWRDDNAFIANKPNDAKNVCTLHIKDNFFGVWINESGMWICRAHNKQNYIFGVKFECKGAEIPLRSTAYPLKDIKEFFQYGLLYFEDTVVKNTIFSLLQSEKLRN